MATRALLLVAFILCLSATTSAQTKIAVAVNNGVVTTNQITQRARFLRLTGFKGDTRNEAQRQLINEELQFQEGKRINFSVPDKTIDEAFGNIAKGNRLSSRQFEQALKQQGINPSTFKRFIRARILWQQIVIARARQEGRRPQPEQDITSILFNRDNGGKNRKVKEYTIDQIIFVTKKGSSKSAISQRRRELEAFKNQNKTCKQASEAALRLASSGVIMRKIGRYTTDTLPDDIRKDVLGANGQLFSTPKQGDSGIGVLAICNVREIVDNSAPKEGLNVEVGKFNSEELQKKAENWMKDLRKQAKIIVR
ncbi:MAG: SurA N-terminal domain-containing protein [Hyphomicrobiales bacterium]